jgi:hypothetical protein
MFWVSTDRSLLLSRPSVNRLGHTAIIAPQSLLSTYSMNILPALQPQTPENYSKLVGKEPVYCTLSRMGHS